jgi:hypothetical protein
MIELETLGYRKTENIKEISSVARDQRISKSAREVHPIVLSERRRLFVQERNKLECGCDPQVACSGNRVDS